MKILYIITKSNWGGAQRHVFDLAVNSKQNGHEVVVALGGEGMLRDRLREEGVTTRPIGSLARDMNLLKDSASLFDIFKVVRQVRPDILHLHSPKAAGFGSLAGRLLKIRKIIFTVHGWNFNEDRVFWEKVAVTFFSWLTVLFCTHVITLSKKEMGQALLFPFIDKKKIRMVNQGMASPTFFAAGSARQMFQSKVAEPFEKKVIIGTIAELHQNKGLIYAINALEKLVSISPSFVFFVIGEGVERDSLEKIIKEKELENHVILLGYIPNAAEYLKGLSIFLLPSVKEGLPYCLIEAGYAGLPVIATTVGGIPELIDDMKSGVLVQSKKSDEIFYALQFLIEHKSIQREYARNLQEKVKSTFNLEQMLATIEKIYGEVLHTPKPQ